MLLSLVIRFLHFYVRFQKWTQKIFPNVFYYVINNLPFQLYLKFQAYIVARLLRLVSDMNLRLLDRIFPRIFLGQIELSGLIFLRHPNRVPRFCTRAFCCELDEIFHSVKKITKKYKIMWKWPIALVKRNFAMSIATAHYALISEKKVQFTFWFFKYWKASDWLRIWVKQSEEAKNMIKRFFWKYSMT